jgi:hypothetical protein
MVMRVGLAVGLMAVAASACLGGSALAQETMWDGYLSVGAGNSWFSDPYDNWSNGWVQGRGTAEFSLPGNWGTQFDVVGTQQALSDPSDSNFHSIDLAAHVFYRQPGQWLFGPLFQYRTSTLATPYYAYGYDQYFVGAEAQGYLGKFSLYGQVAYQSTNDLDPGFSGWVARVRGRYFVTPDWFFEASYLHSALNENGYSYASTEDTFGAGTEFHVPTLPLGVFAQYTYSSDRTGGYNTSVSRILGGFKWYFGGHSLWDRETGGASLDPLPPPYESLRRPS